MKLSVTNYGPAYYEEHRAAGLDYLGHGEWQENYAKWMCHCLNLKPGMRMLDVGCACGSILEGFRKQGLLCEGIDLSEHMVKLGRETFPGLRLEVMDAINMHLFDNARFDFVHSAQVAEHWRPDHVDLILGEIWRVMFKGAKFFCCMDTTDFFGRHGRTADGPGEDPTHLCVRPLAWWKSRAYLNGLHPAIGMHGILRQHPLSFFTTYDWDAMVLEAS